MKTKHILSLLQSGYTTAAVSFPTGHVAYQPLFAHSAKAGQVQLDSRTYTYKGAVADLKPGDPVVVETNSGLKIAYVAEVHDEPQIDPDAEFEYRWIVAKVDMSQYKKVLEAEKKLAKAIREAELAKRREEIRSVVTSDLPQNSKARAAFEDAIAETRASLGVKDA